MLLRYVCIQVLLWLPTMAIGQDQPPRLPATTIQLPTFGVAIDARGELTVKTFVDPSGQLRANRIAAARAQLNRDVAAPSPLRKVSLAGLERAIADTLEGGGRLDELFLYLAGMQRVQFVFLFPQEQDVVLAGPAEGWFADASGRTLGLTSGRPVLRLDDLATALRAYPLDRAGRAVPFLGCTIDPSPDGLTRLREFQKTIPSVIQDHQRTQFAETAVRGARQALGMAQVRIFGVPPSTHFAQVLVEADYRMKCMAVGLERPPVAIPTFLGSLRTPPTSTLQRWWFTPDYDCLAISDDGLSLAFVSQGVKLDTEDRTIGPDGRLIPTAGAPSRAATLFARSFTDRYDDIASASPVYAELRNLIDLAMVAAWLQQQQEGGRTGWSGELLRDEDRLPAESYPVPKFVTCVANAVWVRNRLLLPAGGGVSISANEALRQEHRQPEDPALTLRRAETRQTKPADQWWWD